MKADQTTKLLMEARKQMYQLFSRIFILEADEKLFYDMKAFQFPDAPEDTDFAVGYQKLKDYFVSHDTSDIINLEADYARIFLAAGVAQGLAAFPYESVYTNKKHLMNQEASEDVTVLYGAKGLKAREDMYKIPNDHIGLEFEYMARLCEGAAQAAGEGNETVLAESMREQTEFCKHHMKRWMTMFCNDVIKYAETDFYRAVGTICRGFVREEISLLA